MILKDAAAVIPALIVPSLGAAAAFHFQVGGSAFAFSKAFLILWPAFWFFAIDQRHLQELFRFFPSKRALLLGLGSGVFLGGFCVLGYWAGLGSLLEPKRPEIEAAAASWGSLSRYWFWALAISGPHSALEEIYWRGFVHTRLERLLGPSAAILIGAAGFSLHHGILYWKTVGAAGALFFCAAVAVAGAVWGTLYRQERSLWGPWISHAAADVALFGIGAHFLKI